MGGLLDMKTLDDFVINESDYYKDTFEELRKEYFESLCCRI